MTSQSQTANASAPSTSKHSSALYQLQSPDGYYKYLGITKPPQSTSVTSSFINTPKKDTESSDEKSSLDVEKIVKSYRKLSLKHHPDRPGGDAETFRVLKRAKLVLLDDKMRKDYDLLGLDLEEDQENEDHQEEDDNEKKLGGNQPDTVLSNMGSATIAAILQLSIKTALMGITSTVITRYKYILYISMLFFIYTSFRVFQAYNQKLAAKREIISPLVICAAMYVMHTGRNTADEGGDWWTWKFYFGESTVMTIFILNSLTQNGITETRPSIATTIGFAFISMICCFVVKGRLWRYGTTVLMELGLALIAVVVFPLMEMVMEEVMKEKMKRVGEKVRAYSKMLEEEMSKAYKNGSGGEQCAGELCEEKADALKKRKSNGSTRNID